MTALPPVPASPAARVNQGNPDCGIGAQLSVESAGPVAVTTSEQFRDTPAPQPWWPTLRKLLARTRRNISGAWRHSVTRPKSVLLIVPPGASPERRQSIYRRTVLMLAAGYQVQVLATPSEDSTPRSCCPCCPFSRTPGSSMRPSQGAAGVGETHSVFHPACPPAPGSVEIAPRSSDHPAPANQGGQA